MIKFDYYKIKNPSRSLILKTWDDSYLLSNVLYFKKMKDFTLDVVYYIMIVSIFICIIK